MRSSVWRDLLLITLGGIVLRLLFLPDPGHVADLQTFGDWALHAADNPWDRGYEATDANYPPAALIVFELIGRAYRGLGLNDPVALRVALKMPSVLFDAIGSLVLFAVAARFVPPRPALAAAALFAFNPAIVYDSSLWGQNDSITTVTALAAVWCVLARRRTLAWVLLALAVLTKPPVIVLAPLFALEAWCVPGDTAARRGALVQTLLGIGAAILCGYLVALPFYSERSIVAVYSRMIDWYQVGSSLYPYTSANGFNLWALWGDFFLPDTDSVLGLPVKYWADGGFIALAAFIALRYVRRPDARALPEACFVLMLGFFLVLTEMHERYLMYALTFGPALAVIDRRYLSATLTLTLTTWLNLEYSLTYMWLNSDKPVGINAKEFAPVLVHLCVLGNLAAFGLAMQTFLEPASAVADRELI